MMTGNEIEGRGGERERKGRRGKRGKKEGRREGE